MTVEDLKVKDMRKNRHLSKTMTHHCFYTDKAWLLTTCKKYRMDREVNTSDNLLQVKHIQYNY